MATYRACYPLFNKCNSNSLEDSKNVSEEPKVIGKMTEITIKPNYKEASVYADDDVAEQIREFDFADITLGVDEADLETYEDMFGQTAKPLESGNSKMMTEKGDTDANFGTHGYIYAVSKNNKRSFVAVMLHRAKFEPPEEKATTKGETITFNTPSISGKAYKDEDGNWRTRVFGIETLKAAKEILKNLVTRKESTLVATPSGSGDLMIDAEQEASE